MNVFTMANSQRLSIQSISNSQGAELIIPVGYQVPEAGEYTLKVSEFINLPSATEALLVDKVANETYPLNSELAITFTASADVSEDRFQIVFRSQEVLNTHELAAFDIYAQGPAFRVEYPGLVGAHRMNLYTTDGKEVLSQMITFERGNFLFQADLARDRVYVLRIDAKSIKFSLK